MVLLLILALAEFIRNALVLSFLPLYGHYIMGYNLALIGTAISLQYLIDNLFRIPVGCLNDHFGSRWLMVTGTILFGSGIFLMYAHWNTVWVFIGAGLTGLGFSPVWPVVVAGMSALAPVNQMSETLSKVFIAWLIGGGLGPVVINLVIGRSFGIAFGVLMGGVLIALTCTLVWHFPPQCRTANSLNLRSIWQQATSLKTIYPGMFAQTMALGIIMPILTVYLRSVFNLTVEQISLFMVGAGIFTVILLVPAGKLTDRWGVKKPLTGGFLLAAIFIALLPLQKAIIHAVAVGAFIGIAYSFILPAWNGFLGRAVSPETRGTMWAFFMSVEGLGMAAGSYVGGKVWENLGHWAPFLVSSLILLIMAVFYWVYDMERLLYVNHD